MTTKLPPAVDPKWANLYDENGVFYPEEDGMPMPDAESQGRIFRAVLAPLDYYVRRNWSNAHVAGNTFIYYEQGNPRRFVSPDCYVVFDVDVDHIFYRNTYRVWEMGKPPDFALEIASESTAINDVRSKPGLYASIGIGEYWLYDATPDSRFYGLKLYGGYLDNGRYEPFDIREDSNGLVWGYSPALGLDLCWDAGLLRYRNPATGEFLPDYREMQDAWHEADGARRESEDARQEAAAARAREAAARREAEDARAREATARQESEDARREAETVRAREAAARREAEDARREAEAEAAELREQLRRLQG